MEEQTEILAEKAKSAASRTIFLVDQVMAGTDELARAAAIDEAQEVILALVAAVIAADGATTHQEFTFSALLTKNLRDPLRCRAYLDDYAERWKMIAERTPGFLLAAINYDVRNRTKVCSAILTNLRTLVQYAAVVDGEPADSEVRVAADLLNRVNTLFRQARWSVKWDEDSLPPIHSSRTIARDDFPDREIV